MSAIKSNNSRGLGSSVDGVTINSDSLDNFS
jgi:adhesin HecA-like repeat protein